MEKAVSEWISFVPQRVFCDIKEQRVDFMSSFCITDEWEDNEVLAWAEAIYEQEEIEEQEK